MYCGACHAFPQPNLLDKKTWLQGVLPQMAPRVGVSTGTLFNERFRNPQMVVLDKAVSRVDWDKIVAFYRDSAPDRLPEQSFDAPLQLDPPFFATSAFVPRLPSSGIVTVLAADTVRQRIFVGEAGSNTLRVFGFDRRLLSSVTLGSPPTGVIADGKHLLVLESGILDPNDEPKGSLVRYEFGAGDSLHLDKVLIDSLFRPVFVQPFDFDHDGVDEYVICEFGNNRGRFALYKYDGATYERHVLDATPGAIRFEIRDMTGDGAPDIVALFAQGDERIVLFENDGHGNFFRVHILALFPPVYGSMYFALHDFNGDGKPDILYVNGDNFDYSRILKPYHGVRILENDGKNRFHERYFFPIYGAAQALAIDFDKDGDLDIIAASNFADLKGHPERGIVYLENRGGYRFRPYDFTVAGGNQWNVMAAADLDKDGWTDVLIGSMNLATIARVQQRFTKNPSDSGRDAILVFGNRMKPK